MESANLLQESNPYLVAPNEILRILQDLKQEKTFVSISLPQDQKILTVLLDIDVDAGYFLYDTGRNPVETKAILSTSRVYFRTNLNGVSVRFTTPTPIETVFEGGPALRSPLPTDMVYIQRREHYRTKVIRPSVCTAKLANGTEISMIMSDLSVGGVRLQSGTISPDLLPVGTVLKHALLDFQDLGKVEVTLVIASQQTATYEGIATYYYGCHFQNLSRDKETKVQRLVFALELINRPNTRSKSSDSWTQK
jgi:c-di-GMP-binding flagellar brake protein YcgR